MIQQCSSVEETCRDFNERINIENNEELTLGRKKESRCYLKAYSRHWFTTAKDFQQEMTNHMREFRRQIKLDTKLCDKIEEKYLPFGLESLVPESLKCQFQKTSKVNFTKTGL